MEVTLFLSLYLGIDDEFSSYEDMKNKLGLVKVHDLGLDSLGLMDMFLSFEDKFGVKVSITELHKAHAPSGILGLSIDDFVSALSDEIEKHGQRNFKSQIGKPGQ